MSGRGKGAVGVGLRLLDLGLLERDAGSFIQKGDSLDCLLNDFAEASGRDGFELEEEGELAGGLLAEI